MDRMKKLYCNPLGTTDEKNSSRSIRKLTEQKIASRRHARTLLKRELAIQLNEIPLSTEDEMHASHVLFVEEITGVIADIQIWLQENAANEEISNEDYFEAKNDLEVYQDWLARYC